jgi:hypothetical protein
VSYRPSTRVPTIHILKICTFSATGTQKNIYILSFETKSYFKVLRKLVRDQAEIIVDLNSLVLEAMEKKIKIKIQMINGCGCLSSHVTKILK